MQMNAKSSGLCPPPGFEFIMETKGGEIRKLQVPLLTTDRRLLVSYQRHRQRQSLFGPRTGVDQIWSFDLNQVREFAEFASLFAYSEPYCNVILR